jgi:hypothetical protein
MHYQHAKDSLSAQDGMMDAFEAKVMMKNQQGASSIGIHHTLLAGRHSVSPLLLPSPF